MMRPGCVWVAIAIKSAVFSALHFRLSHLFRRFLQSRLYRYCLKRCTPVSVATLDAVLQAEQSRGYRPQRALSYWRGRIFPDPPTPSEMVLRQTCVCMLDFVLATIHATPASGGMAAWVACAWAMSFIAGAVCATAAIICCC